MRAMAKPLATGKKATHPSAPSPPSPGHIPPHPTSVEPPPPPPPLNKTTLEEVQTVRKTVSSSPTMPATNLCVLAWLANLPMSLPLFAFACWP